MTYLRLCKLVSNGSIMKIQALVFHVCVFSKP